ncbi:MAG: helix-turn-helix domain-containing protein [Phycisphaerae bacterium]
MVGSVTDQWDRGRGRSPADPPGTLRRTPSGRFTCPNCKRVYGDPMYHGPIGHAPQELCFDCWASEWDAMTLVMSRGGNWQQLDAALFLICQGFTHKEAADAIGVCRNTVWSWVRTLRQRPGLAPEWLIDRVRSYGAS